MPGFEELGLSEAVVANAREEGIDNASAFQRSIIPVIRRGGNAIIRASSGSGVTAAYAMALVDRIASGEVQHALVIVPTLERAERVAATFGRLASGTNVRATSLSGAWSRSGEFNVTVASAEKLTHALEDSVLRLDKVDAVIVDGVGLIEKLSTNSLETIFATLPREGQRIFIANDLTESVRKIAESHARKALYFPPRPAVEASRHVEGQPGDQAGATIRYAVAANKADVIARLARDAAEITLVCRSERSAKVAQRELEARGFNVHAVNFDGFARDRAQGLVFAYDAPFSEEQLSSFRANDVIVCGRNDLSHVKSLAQDANVKLEAAQVPADEKDSLNSFRNEIRRAAKEEDLEAQMLVLEPLFKEFSPEEIAAAAASLLRARRPLKSEPREGKGIKTWARLFISIGERDGIRAGDLVGAITGETGINGDDVGRVDIRDTFSVIEVGSGVADKVIRGLNGTTMKNRALRVDYDRKTTERKTGDRKTGDRKTAAPQRGRGGSKPNDRKAPSRPFRRGKSD